MAINAPDKHSTVLVAHPPGNGHIVDPAHHGVADKVVAAIVVAESVHTSQSSSFVECSFETVRRCILAEHPGCRKEIGRTVTSRAHLLKQRSQCIIKVYGLGLVVLAQAVLAYGELLLAPIRI